VSDRETDRQHPLKARRPIASGALSVPVAIGSAIVLAVLALISAFMLGWPFFIVAAIYLALKPSTPGRSSISSSSTC
jgi:4-hydroxybenzoate polyprenyltransferase